MAQLRKPPIVLHDVKGGTCKWCRLPTDTSRKTWHPECAAINNFYKSPQVQRQKVFERDRGICADCGVDANAPKIVIKERELADRTLIRFDCIGWQADHRFPLWLVDRDAPDALRFWGMENLQTLCTKCHTAKTSREAGDRAKIVRLHQKQQRAKEKAAAKREARRLHTR